VSSGLKISNVGLPGQGGTLVWRQTEDGLLAQLPEAPVCEYATYLNVELG
jgi:hypothetical protein